MPPELIVRGVAELNVTPDHATAQVVVEAKGSSQQAAYDDAATLATAVDAVLEAHGPALSRAVTTAVLVKPQMRWRGEEMVQSGWRAGRTTVIDIPALDQVGHVLGQLAHAGASLTGPSWHVKASNPAHEAVRTAAARDARHRATAYADALDLALGDIAWVAEPGLRSRTGAYDDWSEPEVAVALAASGGQFGGEQRELTVSPAEVTLRAAVELGVVFRARPPD